MTTRKVVADGKLTVGELGVLYKKQIEIARRINEGTISFDSVIVGLQLIIEGKINVCPFPIWKTIKLGTGLKNSSDFRKALEQSRCRIGESANYIIGGFTVSKTELELDLVNVSVADLGFKNGAKQSDIYDQAKHRGLALCPAEVGPQLRLQYLNQPNDERLRVAMDPLVDSNRALCIFSVERSDVRLLHAGGGGPGNFRSADIRFVFVIPRVSFRA